MENTAVGTNRGTLLQHVLCMNTSFRIDRTVKRYSSHSACSLTAGACTSGGRLGLSKSALLNKTCTQNVHIAQNVCVYAPELFPWVADMDFEKTSASTCEFAMKRLDHRAE